jgi:hypothetical protein
VTQERISVGGVERGEAGRRKAMPYFWTSCATWSASVPLVRAAPAGSAACLRSRDGFIWTSLTAAVTLLECAAEAVRLGAGFDDVRPIGDAIQQGFAQAGVGNDLRPLRKRQVRRQQYRRTFGAIGTKTNTIRSCLTPASNGSRLRRHTILL